MDMTPSARQTNCSLLAPDTCAAACLPSIASDGRQSNFSCGNWWQQAQCCNGSTPHLILDTVFFDCSCASPALTRHAFILIGSLAAVALITVLLTVLYIVRRRRRKLDAEEEQVNRAQHEAAVFLPR